MAEEKTLRDTLVGVVESTVKSYKFNFENHGWATVTIDDLSGGLTIDSDFGNWCYTWPGSPEHWGAESLTEFLVKRTDAHYIATKLGMDREVSEVDIQSTKQKMRAELIDERKNSARKYSCSNVPMHKDTARLIWNDIDLFCESLVDPSAVPCERLRRFFEPIHTWIEYRHKYQHRILTDELLPVILDHLRSVLRENKKDTPPLHMWEVEHNYYMADESFWGHNCARNYPDWKSFIEAEGHYPMDLNLIFRWDWQEGPTQSVLHIYWASQRKGYFRVSMICVDKQDEQSILTWMYPRFRYLMELWDPFTWVDRKPVQSVKEVVTESTEQRDGQCDACESSKITVTPTQRPVTSTIYDPDTKVSTTRFKGDERVWMCDLCINTFSGNSHLYPTQYEYGVVMQTICFASNNLFTKMSEVENFNSEEITQWLKDGMKVIFDQQLTTS